VKSEFSMISEVETEQVGLRALPQKQISITFTGVLLAMFLGSLDQTIVGTAMPRIISDLGGFTHYTWITISYMIASTVAVPITGKLIDMYGRKKLYIAGLSIFIVCSLLSGLSQTMTQIIIFRGLQGIGGGIMIANAFTLIGDLFPPGERGKYQGIMSGVFGLSSIIGPPLGGFLTDSLSWHWIFFINIPLGLIVIALFMLFFPDVRPDIVKHKVDYYGVITLILAVVPALLALSWGGVEYPWLSVEIIGMFVFSIIMGVAFIIIERRGQNPIIPLSLFNNRILAVSEIVIFFTGIGMFGSIIFVPLFFQGVLGVSATTSGSFLTPMMLGMVGGSFVSGQLLSRAGGHYRIQGTAGIAIMTAGMYMLSRMTMETSYSMAVVNIVVTGFGLGIIMPLYTIAVQNAVPYEVLGVATSLTAFFRSLGGSVGLAIFGSVMNNRFASSFMDALPPSVKTVIPAERLELLVRNPQALVSVEAQAQLKNMFETLGAQGTTIFEQVLQLVGVGVLVIAFVVNFFIKEIPLRKVHTMSVQLNSEHSDRIDKPQE